MRRVGLKWTCFAARAEDTRRIQRRADFLFIFYFHLSHLQEGSGHSEAGHCCGLAFSLKCFSFHAPDMYYEVGDLRQICNLRNPDLLF